MTDKAPSSEARVAAQRRFLQIAHELKPELVESLFRKVLPLYAPIRNDDPKLEEMLSDPGVTIKRPGESWGGIHYPKGRWRHNPTGAERPLTDDEIQRLADRTKRTEEYSGAFREWLKDGNLFEDWQLAHAAQTIYTWAQPECDKDYNPAKDPAPDPDAGWPYLSASYSPALQVPEVDVGWDYYSDPDEAEKRALAEADELRKNVKEYYRAIRGKQKRKSDDPDRHSRWLVRRQILGEKSYEIALSDEENSRMYDDPARLMAVETVRVGIKQAEALVGSLRNEQPALEVSDDDPDDIRYVK